MVNSHEASAIAQIVFYTPMVLIAHYVGIRAWKSGPRSAWYFSMAFSLVRLIGGAMVLATYHDFSNRGLITGTIVLLNLGLVPLIMPFRAFVGLVLDASFPQSKLKKIFMTSTHVILFGVLILLSAAGGFAGHPEDPDKANIQSTLAKVAYFGLLLVLLALINVVLWLYTSNYHRIRAEHIIYVQCLLITSPLLVVRTVFGIISVFEASGLNIRTSMWSPLFGNAILFSLMALLPEFWVLCVYVHMGRHRYTSRDEYGLRSQKESSQRTSGRASGERRSQALEMA